MTTHDTRFLAVQQALDDAIGHERSLTRTQLVDRLLDATAPVLVGGDAVEAALKAWTRGRVWMGPPGVDLSRNAIYREDMSRAIAAADAARGRSYVEWRRSEEYEQMPNDPLSGYVLICCGDRTAHWQRDRPLPAVTDRWAEMPTPPPWTEPGPTQGVLDGAQLLRSLRRSRPPPDCYLVTQCGIQSSPCADECRHRLCVHATTSQPTEMKTAISTAIAAAQRFHRCDPDGDPCGKDCACWRLVCREVEGRANGE